MQALPIKLFYVLGLKRFPTKNSIPSNKDHQISNSPSEYEAGIHRGPRPVHGPS